MRAKRIEACMLAHRADVGEGLLDLPEVALLVGPVIVREVHAKERHLRGLRGVGFGGLAADPFTEGRTLSFARKIGHAHKRNGAADQGS